MSSDRFRKNDVKVAPSVEFENMLSRLLGSTDSVKEVERVIKSPDSETKITYDVQIDPLTGRQKVVERFTTTKQECALCSGYFSQLFTCADCGAHICLGDSREYYYASGHRKVCKNCASSLFGLAKSP
jgi:hypothetical protein